MERENLELRRLDSTSFQDLLMTQNHHHPLDSGFLAGGDRLPVTTNHRQHQADASIIGTGGFWTTGNHHHHHHVTDFFDNLNGITENHSLRPEIGYNNLTQVNNSVHVNPRYPHTLFDPLLELEFARLSLTSANRHPGYMAAPPGNVGSGFNDRNLSSVDLCHENGGLSIMEIRVHEAARAQMELHPQPQNCLSMYNSGRSSNGAAAFVYGGHQPHALRSSYEIGYGRSNTNHADLQYSQIQSPTMNYHLRQRSNFSSLRELRGCICNVAKDQYGTKFLQNKIAEGNPEEIQMIFMEVNDSICDLMINENGNYVTQKLFEVCNQEQMNQLLLMATNDEYKFKNICVDNRGTRSVQKLLEHLTTPEQRSFVASVLRRITMALTHSNNGQHVIQHCLKLFSFEENKHILNVVANNCLNIATDKFGCCVLQQCVEHAVGELRDRLLADITSNALGLSENIHGNYVVQYVLGLKLPHATAEIMERMSGNFVSLSMNKYGSHVVEKCLRALEQHYVVAIIDEIMYSPQFLRVVTDSMGNYVVQCAVSMSKGAIHDTLVERIRVNQANLHTHPYGKRVLDCIKGSNKPRV